MDPRESKHAARCSGMRPSGRIAGRRVSAAERRRNYPRSPAACPRGRAGWIPILIAAFSAAGPLIAQPDHEHLHEPLGVSDALAWPELIERAVEYYPRFVELAARDAEARALMGRARRWLAGQPAVTLRYQSDQPYDDVNVREYELGIQLPLWLPGQRRAAGTLGQAALAESGAASTALRHEVIGVLRLSLWDIERAAIGLEVARDRAGVAAELESVVERLYEAGDLPLSETLLMRSTTLERDAAVIEAEALLVDAERVYQTLTGLDVRPSDFAESLTERDDFDPSHPFVAQADAELARARASVEVADRARGTPTLTIGPRRERGAFSDYSSDSLGLSFSMPVGGRSYRRVEVSAAARLAAEAEADRLDMLRRLELELHEARHDMQVIETSLELARQRSELSRESFAMSRQAFLQGEMTLLELLRREEADLRAQREVAGLEVERQRAIARINQAVGVWP